MPFTPYFADFQPLIISELSGANESIKAAIGRLSDPGIIKTLRQAAGRGIPVEIIVQEASAIQELANSNIRICYHTPAHGPFQNKFCLIDDKLLITGSWNWTTSVDNSSFDTLVIVKDEPETIAHFIDDFTALKIRAGVTGNDLPVLHGDILELKTQVYILENELAALEVKKAELENVILDFEAQLKIEAGDLMFEKLNLERKLQELIAHLTQKQDDFEILKQKDETIHGFEKAWQEAKIRNRTVLNEADETEMKKIYHQAMMAVHPDRFMNEPEKQEEANRLASILSTAYNTKDFQKVMEIWNTLRDGLAFKSDWFNSNDISFFKKLLALLTKKKQQLEQTITELEQHMVWTIRNEENGYTVYFEQLRNTLQSNISMLKNEIKKYQQ